MRTVAALYVDPLGPYPKLEGVECWDETRDARLYDGPHPVVAHPPCGPWGSLRHLSTGGGADCGPRAEAQVRMTGGILEHPSGSKLFDAGAWPLPSDSGKDCFGGHTIIVDQVSWGHVCRKRTWLYIVGVPIDIVADAAITWAREPSAPTRSISGRRGKATQAQHPSWKVQLPRATDLQRRLSPPLFAEWLISLARSVCG
jgi:hypothetical protein